MSNDIIEPTVTSTEAVSDESKTRAIIAHITLIGWVIALVQNNNNKSEFASFYIRQMLGLLILSLAGSVLAIIFIGFLLHIAALVFWIMSIVAVTKKEMTPTPIVGKYFQDWFKSM